MKLIELRITPNDHNGWASPTLTFGEDITQLYGPNGCGKTPVIHSIAYALGYPVKYRDDILKRCKTVELKISHKDEMASLIRAIDSTFDVKFTFLNTGKSIHFYNERDLTYFLFEFLEIEIPTLTNNQNKATSPYIATFLPLFYVDQDSGYTTAYKAPSSFIKHQYAEMVRIALGVPPKNAFELKKILIKKKADLADTHLAIVNKMNFIERLLEENKDSTRSVSVINRNIVSLKNELEGLKTSHDASNDANLALRNIINEKMDEKRDIDSEIRNLEDRIFSFHKIQEEIELEINTLQLNAESRRLFSSFEDICSNSSCQLFLNSSESYGKNLVYLRDQIKDLERNNSSLKRQATDFMDVSEKISFDINSLKENLITEQKDQSVEGLVNAISKLTSSLIDLQKEKEIGERLAKEKNEHMNLINIRHRLHNDIASMENNSGSIDIRILEFKSAFKNTLIDWLDILKTKNVSREISVDSDFNILFGTERITQLSGSTLLRVVLAIKAAFFDLYISRGEPKIEFIIFDTPKQHDIETEHFGAFIQKLKQTVTDKNCQVIFSTTEYHYIPEDGDIEWVPTFLGEEQNMFLGPVIH